VEDISEISQWWFGNNGERTHVGKHNVKVEVEMSAPMKNQNKKKGQYER
jgi:uncharacterized protein YndB with AHSA1/START domain